MKKTKHGSVRAGFIALLNRGATLEALIEQTGWNPGSVRAMLSVLRREYPIERIVNAKGVARYKITRGAA